MDWKADPRISQVLDVLAARVSSRSIEEIGPGAWALPFGEGPGGLVYARLEGDWLRLATPGLGEGAGIEALERNTQLGGFAKLAVDTVPSVLHARAELPFEPREAFARILDPTLVGVARVAGHVPPAGLSDEPSAEAEEEDARTLQEVCAAAGWASDVRSEELVSVDLGIPHAAPRAIVERSAESGVVRVSATFVRVSSPSEVRRDAVARFLLRAASEVRMVRPVALIDEDQVAPGFEVRFETTPTSSQLGHAIAALHVAVRRTGREVAALGADEGLAGAFLRFLKVESPERSETTSVPSTAAASALAANA